MARAPVLTIDALCELGAEKLAQLVLDEAGANSSFRRQVTAALAARKGPQAVAAIIDRRLAALEKARGYVDWERTRGLRDDLSSTLATIHVQLGGASPITAVERLLRFIASHEQVFDRIDDSSGHVQGVYEDAIAAFGDLTSQISTEDAALLPERVMTALGKSTHGYLVEVTREIVEHLPKDALGAWQADLAARQRRLEEKQVVARDDYARSASISQFREMRQLIADVLDDLETVLALEEEKHPNRQNLSGMAARLLEAGRSEEALAWIRRKQTGGLRFATMAMIADGLEPQRALVPGHTKLEAKILETLGRNGEAQTLRWATFEVTFDPEMLKDYIAALPDFEEFAALDRAFEHALQARDSHSALQFLVEWPKLDLASRLVISRKGQWNGRQYTLLPPMAEALQGSHPLAATILYRALLDEILATARSKAYPHGARYLKTLGALAARSDAEATPADDISTHATYLIGLQKQHGRKVAFWSLTK
jgi:hypothetical protein